MNNEVCALSENLSHGYDLIIIGASGGIGQYLIKTYKDTNNIFGTYCHHTSSDLIKGPQYYLVDLSDTAAINEFIYHISDQVTRPVLIYTSGISPNNPVHKVKDDDLNQTLAVNLTGAILITRGILPVMRKLKFGRFIYLSSILSRMAVHGTSVYSVTKAGLNAFSKVVALENAKLRITANSIALGYFDVGIIAAVPPDYLNNKVIPSIPQGRLGSPVDIVNVIEFIIKTSYLTGSIIDLNGGIIAF
jgi:NAD(P)-dependent dehydrogenase (short-subunit alcohol dehydrogenase family)